MSTTGVSFCKVSTTTLNGSAVTTAPYIDVLEPNLAAQVSEDGGNVVVDRFSVSLGLTALPKNGFNHPVGGLYSGAYAKNGAVLLTLTTTTPQSIDLTNLALNTPASNAGDTVFATVNQLVFRNLGATDLVLSPGASNPANAPLFTGTSPTIAIPANSAVTWMSAAGATVDSTHKVFTITPTTGGSLAVSVGGA